MRRTVLLTVVLALVACAAAGAGQKPRDPLEKALNEKFPAAPATLEEAPGPTGLLLLHARGTRSFKVSGAILERVADSELIRVSRFEDRLIVFAGLEPGRYRLRLLKFKDWMGGPLTTTFLPNAPFQVEVEAGAVHYLGVVRARIKTIFNSRAEIEYDIASEVEAWNTFKTAYPDSPWIAIVDRHLDALDSRSGGPG